MTALRHSLISFWQTPIHIGQSTLYKVALTLLQLCQRLLTAHRQIGMTSSGREGISNVELSPASWPVSRDLCQFAVHVFSKHPKKDIWKRKSGVCLKPDNQDRKKSHPLISFLRAKLNQETVFQDNKRWFNFDPIPTFPFIMQGIIMFSFNLIFPLIILIHHYTFLHIVW